MDSRFLHPVPPHQVDKVLLLEDIKTPTTLVVLVVRGRVGVKISWVFWETILWRLTHRSEAPYSTILFYTEV